MPGSKPFDAEDFRRLVQAVSVPMLVRDWEAMATTYSRFTADEMEEHLQDDQNLSAALDTFGDYAAASHAWFRLYGPPVNKYEIPDTVEPLMKGGGYPELRDHLVEQFCAPFRDIRSMTFEHTVPGPHGNDIIVRSYWKAAGGPDRPYARVVTVDLDVTDFRRTERAAQEIADSRSRIIRTVGHELRNPLAGIVGLSQVVHSEWDSLPDEERLSLMMTVADQARDTMLILEDLLEGEANEQSDLRIQARPVDIAEILTRSDLADFEVHIEDLKPAMADPLRTRQIIRNLTQNARKYGGPNKTIRSFVSDEKIVIQVSDNGDGIQGTNLEHLFEPFNSSNSEGSTGLGLSISKTLALAMQGDLTLRQDLPGTTFELTLPISRIEGGVGTAA